MSTPEAVDAAFLEQIETALDIIEANVPDDDEVSDVVNMLLPEMINGPATETYDGFY